MLPVLSGERIVCQIHGLREKKRKVTFKMEEKDIKIDFVMKKRTPAVFTKSASTMAEYFQHVLVVADIDMKKTRNVVGNTGNERTKISLLKDLKIRIQLQEN